MAKLGMRLEQETIDPARNRRVRAHVITKADYISSTSKQNPVHGRAISGPLIPANGVDRGHSWYIRCPARRAWRP